MASTISSLKKKILGRRSGGASSDDHSSLESDPSLSRLSATTDSSMSIGTPTNVKRLIHAEADENGVLRGLPPEYQRMLEAMTTVEERLNPDNTKMAGNVIIFYQGEGKKREQPGFIRTDWGIGSSGESNTLSTGSRGSAGSGGGGRRSGDSNGSRSKFHVPFEETQEEKDKEESVVSNTSDNGKGKGGGEEKTAGEEKTSSTANDNANANNNVPAEEAAPKDKENNEKDEEKPSSPVPAPAPRPSLTKAPNAQVDKIADGGPGEATLRRKGTSGAGGGRSGPRVTRNITEEEVYAQINLLCSTGHPLDR